MLLKDFNSIDTTLEKFVDFCKLLKIAYDNNSKESCKQDDTKRASKLKAKRKRGTRSDSNSEEEPGYSMHNPKSFFADT